MMSAGDNDVPIEVFGPLYEATAYHFQTETINIARRLMGPSEAVGVIFIYRAL